MCNDAKSTRHNAIGCLFNGWHICFNTKSYITENL